MSCMMIEEKVLERLVSGLAALSEGRGIPMPATTPAEIANALPGVSVSSHGRLTVHNCRTLFMQLDMLNQMAYHSCYGGDAPVASRYKMIRDYMGTLPRMAIAKQCYRDLAFLSYQCAEGDVYRSDRYKMLELIKTGVAKALADEATEDMKWGA